MDLSNNSYTGFWGNPDLSRLEKLHGLQVLPERKSFPLQRGTAFHLIIQAWISGWTEQVLEQAFADEGLSAEAIAGARRLFPVMRDEYLVNQRWLPMGSEVEYRVPLDDKGEHFLTGRIDGVAEDEYGRIKLPEFKSAGVRASKKDIETEWRCSPKAAFDLIGAHYLGHKAEYMEVVTVKDTDPPVLFDVLPVFRSEYDLQYLMRSVLQTCKIITFMEKEFGIEEPWPHVIHSKWKSSMGACNSESEKFNCAFKEICGTRLELGCVPEGFVKREVKVGVEEEAA